MNHKVTITVEIDPTEYIFEVWPAVDDPKELLQLGNDTDKAAVLVVVNALLGVVGWATEATVVCGVSKKMIVLE